MGIFRCSLDQAKFWDIPIKVLGLGTFYLKKKYGFLLKKPMVLLCLYVLMCFNHYIKKTKMDENILKQPSMILRGLRQPDRFSHDIFIRDVSSTTCLPHIPQPQLSSPLILRANWAKKCRKPNCDMIQTSSAASNDVVLKLVQSSVTPTVPALCQSRITS